MQEYKTFILHQLVRLWKPLKTLLVKNWPTVEYDCDAENYALLVISAVIPASLNNCLTQPITEWAVYMLEKSPWWQSGICPTLEKKYWKPNCMRKIFVYAYDTHTKSSKVLSISEVIQLAQITQRQVSSAWVLFFQRTQSQACFDI